MGLFGFFKKKEKVMKYNVLFALYTPGVDLAGTFYEKLNEANSPVRLGEYFTAFTREGVESILVSEQVDVAFIPDIFSDRNRVGKGTLNKLLNTAKNTRFYLVMTEGMDGTPDGVKRRKKTRLAELYREGFYNVIFGEDCKYEYLRDLVRLDGGRTQEEAYIYYGLEGQEDIPVPKGYTGNGQGDEAEPEQFSSQPDSSVQGMAPEQATSPQQGNMQRGQADSQPVMRQTGEGMEEPYVDKAPVKSETFQPKKAVQENQSNGNGTANRTRRQDIRENQASAQNMARPTNGAGIPRQGMSGEMRQGTQGQPVRPQSRQAYDGGVEQQPVQRSAQQYIPDGANLPTLGGFSAPAAFNTVPPVSVNVHIDFCVNDKTAIITFPDGTDLTSLTNRWGILTFIGGM